MFKRGFFKRPAQQAATMAFKSATPAEWRKNLAELPERHGPGQRLPTFFYAHGHPGVYFRPEPPEDRPSLQAANGPLNQFLRDFGPVLLEKYKPKAILVFSAHWDTQGATLVSDWGEDQPLLYDYYGFPPEYYKVQWHSSGLSSLSQRVVSLLKAKGIDARTTGRNEPRGRDGSLGGRGGPGVGLDHGVFIPSLLMFPEGKEKIFEVPIVQVSIDGSFDPWKEYALGEAVAPLRDEGVLIISGGLTIHTFQDWSAWGPETASKDVLDFEASIVSASEQPTKQERYKALAELTEHPGFRVAHPEEDHFAPIWVAAGAGGDGGVTVISDMHGAKTIAFGL